MNKSKQLGAFLFVGMLMGCSSNPEEQVHNHNHEHESGEKTVHSLSEDAGKLPSGILLTTAPEARRLTEVKPTAKAGEEITFTGYIGGREEPFTEGRALFLVADEVAAPQCTDGCPTAWDACCTPREAIMANSASVQLVDKEGKVLKLNLNGADGLIPGSRVTIRGKVETLSESVFVVNATGIHVAK
ncbi:MAG: hypothetical protein SFY68_08135 [Candidatus Sumerlaeia bacterium]|nr:hypothetical protein [Candidatus Sumerlaeia bacterium]